MASFAFIEGLNAEPTIFFFTCLHDKEDSGLDFKAEQVDNCGDATKLPGVIAFHHHCCAKEKTKKFTHTQNVSLQCLLIFDHIAFIAITQLNVE